MPDSTGELWTDQFYKTVYQEYYIMTEIGLTGTVGGTLGLFVGLSVMGSTTWIMGIIENALSGIMWGKRLRKRKH